MMFNPKRTTITPETRFTTVWAPASIMPAPLKSAPSAVNMMENPATKKSVRMKTIRRSGCAEAEPEKATPPMKER